MVSRLRRSGFGGVTVTDSLDAASRLKPVQGGADALRAGADIALYATDAHGVYRRMLRAAEGVPRSRLVASYARIVTLKNSLTP